jgi:uncharacterized phage protein (TIGR01671 family)
MREIKFRAWDKNRKSWLSKANHSIMMNGEFMYNWGDKTELMGVLPDTPKEIEVMQYTGLKDKNGVEIFENDFIKYCKKIYVIKWRKAKFEMIDKTFTGKDFLGQPLVSPSLSMRHEEDLEVIGNIWENTELLK